jgi:hypothetical protein
VLDAHAAAVERLSNRIALALATDAPLRAAREALHA